MNKQDGDILRLVTWNCAMAFRSKWERLAELEPSIAVIQECERPEKWPDIGATSVAWCGDNSHKGLAVLAFGEWRVEPAPVLEAAIQHVLPVRVTGPRAFNLLGVWTKAHAQREFSYIGQLRRALNTYGEWLSMGDAVVAGDLNSNAQWDRPQRPFHAEAVQRIAEHGMVSAYHHYYGERHGEESRATMYLLKQKARRFHLDYIFLPATWVGGLHSVQIGPAAAWLPYSDHFPVAAELMPVK